MSEAKHTPGPWEAKPIDSSDKRSFRYGYDIGIESDAAEIADIGFFEGEAGRAEAEANARLMAAAPDADRILRVLQDYLDGGFGTVSFDTLMPEDGYDGAADDQTLGTAILRYFAKSEGK